MLRIADRSRFIGGTDAPAVLGISPWKTPVQLYLEKRGEAPPDRPDQLRDRIMHAGHKLEPYIRAMTMDKLRLMGHDVELVSKNRRYRDDVHRFLSCEVDFELMLDGEHVNVDAKSVTGFMRHAWGDEETDEVPVHYTAQFMHGLGITGRRRCVVGALIGFHDVAIYFVDRDDEVIDMMRTRCVDFWTDHVKAGVPPDPIKFADIKALYPLDNDRTVEADDTTRELVRELFRLSAQRKQIDARLDVVKRDIGAYMRDAAQLTVGGRATLTYRTQESVQLEEASLRRERPDIAELYSRRADMRVMRQKTNFRP